MKVLDLFSGIGGFSLGLERTGGFETIGFCEIEPFCQKVLRKHWPDVPIYEDIRELNEKVVADTNSSRCGEPKVFSEQPRRTETIGSSQAGVSDNRKEYGARNAPSPIHADVITGGYPCQPFSTAGKRGGDKDDRHLWPEMYRLIRTIRPRWVIAENVAGHISMGLDTVLSDLEAENYAWWTFVIPACAVDAKHRRDRVWILATNTEYLRGTKQEREHQRAEKPDRSSKDGLGAGTDVSDTTGIRDKKFGQSFSGENTTAQVRPRRVNELCSVGNGGTPSNVAHTSTNNAQGQFQELNGEEVREVLGERQAGLCGGARFWEAEPAVGRVADGIPRRVDRLKGLGNAVVPQIPEIIGRAILEAENEPKTPTMV